MEEQRLRLGLVLLLSLLTLSWSWTAKGQTLTSAASSGLCSRKECSCSYARTGGIAALCAFSKRQMLEMNGSDFPAELSSVEMSGGRELRFGTEVFSKLSLLEFVRIASISKVFVREHTFANISSARKIRFEFEEGSSLILEGSSWKNVGSPISVSIKGFGQVIIQGKAFSWLSELLVRQVSKLELLENAFFIEMPKHNASFIIGSIILDDVKLDNLAAGAFHSLTSEVRLRGSVVQRVRTDAFNAISLHHVKIENTTFHKVETGAFSDRTILHTLSMDRVYLNDLESGAVLSGATHLHIRHSRFGVVNSGGFNMTVANVAINYNIFNRIHTKAFTLKQWDNLSINNNTFKKLDPEAFSSQGHVKTRPPVINFTRNNLFDIPSNAFDFEVNDELNPSIDSNFFHFKCRCDMSKSVLTMVKPYTLSESLYQTGLCAIDHLLSKCFELPIGFSSMSNFTDENCILNEVILCEEVQRDAAVPPLPGISSAVDIEYEDDIGQERRIIGSLFIVLLCGMLIMMMLSTLMWVTRNGYCTKARLLMFPSTNSLVNYFSRLCQSGGTNLSAGSAHSISRMSIHEYAELQRKLGEVKDEEEIPLEDKATQTLPEELTQELLQSLQEKLNDPENYSEARNMIEHLYDLIKVEESCNKNYRRSQSINLEDIEAGEENLYELITPKRKMSRTGSKKKDTVSVGTRAPSPDKLLPYPTLYGETKQHRLRPAVSDYMEPRDRQLHTYTELPATATKATSPICDYGEPTDTRVHLYIELPPTAAPPDRGIKMANRPLPSKPIQGETVS